MAQKNTRPVGKTRMVLTPLLLGIITFGIYYLVWLYKVEYEVLVHTDDHTINPAKAVGLLFIPIFWFYWAIYLCFSVPALVRKMEIQEGIPVPDQTSAGLIGVIGLIPIVNLAWAPMIQNALNKHWASHQSN